MVTRVRNTCEHSTRGSNVREGSPEAGNNGKEDGTQASQCMIDAPSLGGASVFFFFVLLPLGRPRGLFPG